MYCLFLLRNLFLTPLSLFFSHAFFCDSLLFSGNHNLTGHTGGYTCPPGKSPYTGTFVCLSMYTYRNCVWKIRPSFSLPPLPASLPNWALAAVSKCTRIIHVCVCVFVIYQVFPIARTPSPGTSKCSVSVRMWTKAHKLGQAGQTHYSYYLLFTLTIVMQFEVMDQPRHTRPLHMCNMSIIFYHPKRKKMKVQTLINKYRAIVHFWTSPHPPS
jgi:hypothetical protein